MLFTFRKKNKFLIFLSLISFLYLAVQFFSLKEIKIKDILTFKKHLNKEYSLISKNSFLKIPLEESKDTIEIWSKIYMLDFDYLLKAQENYLKTQKIMEIKYEGPVDLFFYNEKTSDFDIPSSFLLKNKENPHWIINFKNLKGNTQKGEAFTDKEFEINHRDFFCSGDNLEIYNAFNEIFIKKNSHLIQKKNDKSEMDIRSEYFNYNQIKNEGIFKHQVTLKSEEIDGFSDYLKIFVVKNNITQKNEINEAIFKENVLFHYKNKDKLSKIRSKRAYYFKNYKVLAFCENVELEDEKGFSKGNFYIYETDKKQIRNLQESNKFFIEKIKKLDSNAPSQCITYDKELKTKYILKNEK